MDLTQLTTISPIDGRYRPKTEKLAEWFSEFGFIQLRLKVEIEYLIKLLLKIGGKSFITKSEMSKLRRLYQKFNQTDAEWIKNKEKETNHDVKAIEYFIRSKMGQKSKFIDFIHFALTTYDVTVPAYALAFMEANEKVMIPSLLNLINKLNVLIRKSASLIMLARTHGQPAVGTTLGKEIKVFSVRLEKLFHQINNYEFEAKLSGAAGNFNAHFAAYPRINWIKFSDDFIKSLGLAPNHYTTQILPYDNWLEYFGLLRLLNSVLISFCQDIWHYISDDYLVQIPKEGEVGSSTMPQKVNPIDFENAEGNLGIANSLIEFYERKLPISRLQRDLSDSTVKRTFGVALAHSLLAYQNIETGLQKIKPNKIKMEDDVNNHWETISEGIQTVLRAAGVASPYEMMKALTRGKEFTKEDFEKFIKGLDVPESVKVQLRKLSPSTYIGLAVDLASLSFRA